MYIEYGLDKTLELLNGMFSIALLDYRKKKMYLARDRFGIKPLYIAYTSEKILFAFELKGIWNNSTFKPSINMNALREHFIFFKRLDSVLSNDSELV